MELDASGSARNAVLFAALDRLLEDNVRLEDRTLDVLFRHLSKVDPVSEASFLTTQRCFATAWLVRAASRWCAPPSAHQRLRVNLVSFAVDVAAHVCADEETFSSLNFDCAFDALMRVAVGLVRDPYAQPSLAQSYVGALSSILAHTSGVQWTISTKYWSEAVALAARRDARDVFAECCAYVADLLARTRPANAMFCARILRSLVERRDSMEALRVLHGALEAVWRRRVPPAELSYVNDELEGWEAALRGCLASSDDVDREYAFAVNRTRLLLAFFSLYKLSTSTDPEEFKVKMLVPGGTILRVIVATGTSGDYRHVYELCNLAYSYWRVVRDLDVHHVHEFSADNVRIRFEAQIFTFQTLPVYYVETTKMGLKPEYWDLLGDLRTDYYSKFMKGLHPLTYRYVSAWINYLVANVTYDMAIESIRSVDVSRDLYDAEHLGHIARCFVYLLEDVVTWRVEYSTAAVEDVPEGYVVALLEKNAEMCGKLGLTWRENVETIKVTGIVFDLLSVSSWSHTVTIKSLELLDVAVANYMSPGMALLIDNARDCDIGRLGPVLFAKLRSEDDDVRTATLRVIKTTASLANEKFVSYRGVILDAYFPRTVLKMALDDVSTKVRTAALECLAEIVKVEELCAGLLDERAYFRLMDSVLRPGDASDLVAPTCRVLTAVYSRDALLPAGVLAAMFECLGGVATPSAARLEALAFWRAVVDSRLAHRGMIDGSFPSVTFSRQSKKIVSLDEAGVRRILGEALAELDGLGCLAAFVAALEADERDVALGAARLMGEFAGLLGRYGVEARDVATSEAARRVDVEAFLEMARDLEGFVARRHGGGDEDEIYGAIGEILGPEAVRGWGTEAEEEEEEEGPTYMVLE